MAAGRNVYKIISCLVCTCILMTMTACQGKEDDFQILIYADLPQESVLKGQHLLVDYQLDDIELNMSLYPAMLERVIMDIVAHTGDILIIEKEMLPAILDPIGLHTLDELVNAETINGIKELEASDENGEVHIYAAPISTDLEVFQGLPLSKELVAVIPKYSNHKEEAFAILKSFVH